MPKLMITADDGTQFLGTEELINNLPDEFSRQIKEQMTRASKGQAMEAVRVPRGLLEQAGWMSREEYEAEQKEERAPKQDEEYERQPTKSIYTPRLEQKIAALEGTMHILENDVVITRKAQEGHDCSTCPFKEAAMKLIEKTLKGLE